MRYPILSMTNTEAAVKLRLDGIPEEQFDGRIAGMIDWRGPGEDLDVTPIEKIATDITDFAKEWAKEPVVWYCESCKARIVAPHAPDQCTSCGGRAFEKKDKDQLEGTCAVDLYKALKSVPCEILDDQGFWRYLAVRHFWEFIRLREETPFKNGNHMKYVDAKNSYESVLTRMFLRVKALGGDEHHHMASKIDTAVDFWRSHVVRVRNGLVPAITRALASRQISNHLETDPVREAAKHVTRHWANIVPNVYDDAQAGDLMAGVWDNVEEWWKKEKPRKAAEAQRKREEKKAKDELNRQEEKQQKDGSTPDGP